MSSQQHNIIITISAPESTAAAQPYLILEQADWEPYAGQMTKMEFVRRIAIQLFGPEAGVATSPDMNCPIDASGCVVAEIHAYPSRIDLGYRLITSYGDLSGAYPQSLNVEDVLQFTIDTEQQVPYPIGAIVQAEWLTCYDSHGTKIHGPAPTFFDRTVSVPYPVYGSLRLTYSTYRTNHLLSLSARPDAIEHFWSAWVIGLVEHSQPVMLQIDPPPTVEELAKMGVSTCPDWELNMEWDEDGGPPTVDIGRKEQVYDYCTGELLREY